MARGERVRWAAAHSGRDGKGWLDGVRSTGCFPLYLFLATFRGGPLGTIEMTNTPCPLYPTVRLHHRLGGYSQLEEREKVLRGGVGGQERGEQVEKSNSMSGNAALIGKAG